MKRIFCLVFLLSVLAVLTVGAAAADDPIAMAIRSDGSTEYIYTMDPTHGVPDYDSSTTIRLLQDLDVSDYGFRNFPFYYFADLDLNGFTLTCRGNGIEQWGGGSEKEVTKIYNGTIIAGAVGVRISSGSFILEDLVIRSTGRCVVWYDSFPDPDIDYGGQGRITNCILESSASVCVAFLDTNDHDYMGPYDALYIENSEFRGTAAVFYQVEPSWLHVKIGPCVTLMDGSGELLYGGNRQDYEGSGYLIDDSNLSDRYWDKNTGYYVWKTGTVLDDFSATPGDFWAIVRWLFSQVYRFLLSTKVPVLGFSFMSLFLAIAVIGIGLMLMKQLFSTARSLPRPDPKHRSDY